MVVVVVAWVVVWVSVGSCVAWFLGLWCYRFGMCYGVGALGARSVRCASVLDGGVVAVVVVVVVGDVGVGSGVVGVDCVGGVGRVMTMLVLMILCLSLLLLPPPWQTRSLRLLTRCVRRTRLRVPFCPAKPNPTQP